VAYTSLGSYVISIELK